MHLTKFRQAFSIFVKNTWNHPFFDSLPYQRVIKFSALVVLVFLFINGGMALYYYDRFYPNTQVGAVEIGGMTRDEAYEVIKDHTVFQPVMLAFDKDLVSMPTTQLGITYDIDQTIQQAIDLPRPVLPVVSLLPNTAKSTTEFEFDVDQEIINKVIKEALDGKSKKPVNAEIKISEGQAELIPHQEGKEYDSQKVISQIVQYAGQLTPQPFALDAEIIQPKTTSSDLQNTLKDIRQKLALAIQIELQGEKVSPTAKQIGEWLEINDQYEVVVQRTEVEAYVQELSLKVNKPVTNRLVAIRNGQEEVIQEGQSGTSLDQAQVVEQLMARLKENKSADITAEVAVQEPQTIRPRLYSYCVTANQVSESKLNHFSQKIATTLADSRGWSLDGRIVYQKVASGCDFAMVLAAAHTLPGYSSVCSEYWSCRVGSNVIININRWEGASDSWNQAGGSLGDYQSMVINHEVGHWLGINDNQWVCAGPGQLAPLMQQQSINLRGCTFNPWPLPQEVAYLKAIKGL